MLSFKFKKNRRLNSSKCILLVDDDPLSVETMKVSLEESGYEVCFVRNGLEAFEFLRHKLVDMVVLDFKMPVMNGFNASSHIRALKNENACVPILAVTALESSSKQRLYGRLNIDEEVEKPLDLNVFQKRVRNLFNQPREELKRIREVKTKQVFEEIYNSESVLFD